MAAIRDADGGRRWFQGAKVVVALIGPIDSFAFRPLLNNLGQTAISLSLVQGLGGVTAANDIGYWAQDLSGNLRLLVREGDQITVAPGDIRTIASLGVNGDARGFKFDDLGNLMFRANFTDGSLGIFVMSVPVPEPGFVATVLTMISVILLRRTFYWR